MIIIIIFIIAGIIIGIIGGINRNSITAGVLFGGWFAMVLGCVGAMIAIFIPMQTEYKCVEVHNIVALQDNRNISGSFFLGCGRVDEHMVYYSYVEENGSFELKKFNVDNSLIRFSNQKPRVELWGHLPKKGSIINYFALDLPCTKYIFYVPQGSIKQNFNLDAQ
jgi:uncharacterized membrane protein YeaQ/YmgE (transglycosylase-associated protein family)